MTTVIENPVSSEASANSVGTQYLTPDGQANVALLQDRTPPWMRMTTPAVVLTMMLGLLLAVLSYVPLWHSDLWGHLAYGRWIAAQGAVPRTEPLLPLAQGVRFIDTAWLSQWIGYQTIRQFGAPGIQFLYAALITLSASLLTLGLFQRTRQAASALAALSAFLWLEYQQFLIVRPQLAGVAILMAVWVLATQSRWRRSSLWTIPILFALWANVHGSFIVGLGVLAALTIGRAIDVWRRSRRWRIALSETRFRALLLTTQLSAVAVLLNPYGLSVYAEVFAVSNNPNLSSLIEWEPLTLRMKQGQAAALITLALIALFRLTPRRISAQEVLLLAGLGLATLWHSRMIVWWAPVAAWSLGLHLAAVLRQRKSFTPSHSPATGIKTVVAVGWLWICFAYTPFGYRVLHGTIADPQVAAAKFRRAVTPRTPVEIAGYLVEHPPQGQVFNSYDWGDYLQWAGPPGMQLFLNSHAHLIPVEVWQDYLTIANGGDGWKDKLDRYGVNAIVVDHAQRAGLIRALEESDAWRKAFGDRNGAVFFRREPI